MSVNDIDPGRLFGGTWEQLTQDAYFKIVTANGGHAGGTASDHRIPLTSVPEHRHDISPAGFDANLGATPGSSGFVPYGQTGITGIAGGGQPYYPYYYGVYAWVRTA